MNTETPSYLGTLTLTFLAGAALGAVVMALVSPKSGPELRGSLETMARRAKRRIDDLTEDAGDAWDAVKTRSAHAAHDLKRGVADSAHDLKRGVADSVRDLGGSPAWDPSEASRASASETAR